MSAKYQLFERRIQLARQRLDEIAQRGASQPSDGPAKLDVLLDLLNDMDELNRDAGLLHVENDNLKKELDAQRVELAQVGDELAASRIQTESANSDFEHLTSIAAHDLQEPIRIIATYARMVSEARQLGNDADLNMYIGFIGDASDKALSLIRGLLSYSTIGKLQAPMSLVDMNQVMSEATKGMAPLLHECGGEITFDDLPEVKGDRNQLLNLVENLLGNAIKFRDCAPPKVHVSAVKRGSEWQVSVSDSGIGLDMVYAERIFTMFQRLHSEERFPGNGIGLAVCKKIVERHGGRIWVTSHEGAGSTFCFTLPVV